MDAVSTPNPESVARCLTFEEIRMRDDTGIYRVVYTARLAEAVYVLHAFQKKTQATSRRDIELAKSRYTELMRGTK